MIKEKFIENALREVSIFSARAKYLSALIERHYDALWFASAKEPSVSVVSFKTTTSATPLEAQGSRSLL